MNLDFLKQISEPIFFVTNDVTKGIGLEKLLTNYHIICLDDNSVVDYLLEENLSVFCLEKELGKKNILPRNSGLIINHPLVLKFILEKAKGKVPNIMFFKPDRRIELFCTRNKFNLIGNLTELNEKFENKLSFYEICKKEGIQVLPGEIGILSEMNYSDLSNKYGNNFVVQFGHGWAGNSTFFVNSKDDFINLLNKNKDLKVKITQFKKGKTCLNNAVVYKDQIFFSKPALQIKSNTLLTNNPGGTGGRQWPAGLTIETEKEIEKITQSVGNLLFKNGYRGYFGLDFIVEDKTNAVFLSECNARLTASSPFFTKSELSYGTFPLLAYHLISFLSQENNFCEPYLPEEMVAGEIIARNTTGIPLTITDEFQAGIYDDNLNLLKRTYFLNERSENFWLSFPKIGRVVNPEIEIIKIDSFSYVCDSEGNLTAKFENIIKKIKEISLI